MTSSIDREPWNLVQHPATIAPVPLSDLVDMEKKSEGTPVESQVQDVEVTINTKPTESTTAEKEDAPQLKRNETTDSWYNEDVEFDRRNAHRPFNTTNEFNPHRVMRPVRHIPPPPRRFDYSPPPHRFPAPDPAIPMLNSSVQLLAQLNYDGVVDLPHPARSSVYLSTFPFTDKDVMEWSWLFQLGIEGKFLFKQGDLRDDDGNDDEDDWMLPGDRRGRIAFRTLPYRNRRDRSPIYLQDNGADIASVYLSRVLDPIALPERCEKEFTFVIVVRNRGRAGGGVKLLTAGSRQAAGILIYYEALSGHSVAFVGALKNDIEKGKRAPKYKRVESVDQAAKAAEEGFVGVIC